MSDASIQISAIDTELIQIPIVGTSPLITNRFSEKAKRQMLDAMQGRKSPKKARDPEADYDAAFHRLKDGRFGFPAIGFKGATVGGARYYGKDVSMTALRQFMFFYGEPGEDGQQLVHITGEPVMREDVVRLGRGSTDLRYRPQFTEWTANLQVSYVRSALTRDSVLSLIDAGGLGVGVGEWRPEKGGDFGTYQVDATKGIEVLG